MPLQIGLGVQDLRLRPFEVPEDDQNEEFFPQPLDE